MACYLYILYSPTSNRYYTGISKNPLKRLFQHNYGYNRSTAQNKDWKIVFTREMSDTLSARELEKKIKARGAKRFLNDNQCRK